jgi:hypothetical protein
MAMDNMIPEDRRDVADVIRRCMAANPDADDVEVAVFLDRKGVQVSPALIQQVRWDMARQQEDAGPAESTKP